MKKIILSCLLTLSLSGCVVYDAFFMAKYDNNEYGLITRIKTLAETAECSDKDNIAESAKQIWIYSVELKNFTQYIPRNEQANDMATKLAEVTKGLHNKHGEMSNVYCEEKLKVITKTSDVIQKALGSKPRW
jgi:hypothetical protein